MPRLKLNHANKRATGAKAPGHQYPVLTYNPIIGAGFIQKYKLNSEAHQKLGLSFEKNYLDV